MADKKMSPKDNAANMQNPNEGTSGNNQQYLQAEENRQRQIAESKKSKKSKK
jgi:hypothetical protein